MPYAEVAVDAPAGRSTYTYGVPEGFTIGRGQLVWVPFGARTVRGVVIDVSSVSDLEKTRPISSVSPGVILSPQTLDLASFISERYLSSLFDSISLFLPPGTERRPKVVYEACGDAAGSETEVTGLAARLLQRVRERGQVSGALLESRGTRADVQASLASLVERGLLLRRELPPEERSRSKLETVVSLVVGAEQLETAISTLRAAHASRQVALLEYLEAHDGVSSTAELRRAVQSSAAMLRALEARGLIRLDERRVWRQTLSGLPVVATAAVQLTDAQQLALRRITSAVDAAVFSEHLIFGVTGSGKTEVYLRAAAHALAAGRQALCLVPEISLAAQTVERFLSRFPGRVALLHSGLSVGQLSDEWERVHRGEVDIVVGPRSALFAPLPRPGLIVLDEEQEWTYKQEDVAPRYHARDVARELARSAGAALLLGSATPDVGTYHRAASGDIEMHVLPERIAGPVGLPPVEVVDMRHELRAGNASLFSRSLQSALSDTLARGEQALLFLNRRGTATLVQCRHCGHVFSCPRCSVALAHHGVDNRLLCHRCGFSMAVPGECPRCHSRNIRFLGIGTQRVAEVVRELFPKARLVRWDSDVPASERGGSGLLDSVREHRIDVVVGTQMVAKGHDFPGVTLVGIVSADVGLGVPDYRSSERTFQLISQASGRAGRGVQPGRVVLQTYEPDNYVIQSAAAHDYLAFYREEIQFRRDAFYPPFCAMVRLVYSNSDEERCRREVERVRAELLSRIHGTDIRLVGPSPAFVRRLRGRYRWHIIVRGSHPRELVSAVTLPRGWVVDVDPASVA